MTTTATVHPIDQFITQHGLTMTVEPLQRRSDRRNLTEQEKKWEREASHWRVTIVGKEPRFAYTCEYSMGAAHRKFKDKVGWIGSEYAPEQRKLHEVMQGSFAGKPVPAHLWTLRHPNLMQTLLREITEPTPPALRDVLDSLVSDADGWTNARDFESWCSDYGMDPDSRRAEAMYTACGETAKALRFLVGEAAYNELRTIERL